jgi:hypothetical protein
VLGAHRLEEFRVQPLAELFAQLPPPQLPAEPSLGGWLCAVLGWCLGVVGLIYLAFWLWMLVRCLLHEPDRFFWIWLMVVVPFPGAIVYAVVRVVPEQGWQPPGWLRRLSRRKELARLKAAAEQIGNAHQFVQWGDALKDTGQWPQAAEAYHRALLKEPQNLPALWGAAQTAERLHRADETRHYCRRILDIDPQYKFGDVSLLYARTLMTLGENGTARQHLEQHCRKWRHPEAVYLLARQCHAEGDVHAARQHLQDLLRDLQASPPAVSRKFGRWQSLARKLLKQLPPTTP